MTAPSPTFATVVLPWLDGTPTPTRQPQSEPVPVDVEPDPEPRVTRFVALCALLAWLGAMLVAATVLQVLGVWVWAPTPDAVTAFGCLAVAAAVSVLWLPAREVGA